MQVNLHQLTQIKRVIEESYKEDTTFRTADHSGTHSMVVPAMPVECILMEIRSTLWDTPYIAEFSWFKSHYIGGESWRDIVKHIGWREGAHTYFHQRVDIMLDHAVYRMPNWLGNRCLDIYNSHIKVGSAWGG